VDEDRADQVVIGRALPLAVALTIGLYLGGAMFPIVGALVGMAAIAPGVYLRFQTSLWWPVTAMVLIVVALLFLFFRTPAPAAVYFFEFGLSSLVVDELLRRRRVGTELFFAAAGIATLLLVVLLFAVSQSRGVSPMALTEQFLKANIGAVMALYENAGIDPAQLQSLREAAEGVAAWAGTVFPTLLYVAFFGIQSLGFGAALFFYRRRRGEAPALVRDAVPFSHLQLPSFLVWGLIVSLAGEMFLAPSGALHVLLLNCAGILLFAYLIQGLAIIQFAFEAFAVGRVQRFFFFFFFVAFQFLFILPVLLGIFDIWFDFRRRIVRRQRALKNPWKDDEG